MADWDEFVDNQSGRKFYYNTITKEKSWKPPRKTPGHMGKGKHIYDQTKYVRSYKCQRVSENFVMYVCFQIIGENSLNASPDPQEDVFDTLDKGTEKNKVKKRFLFESRSDSCFSLNKSIDNENVSSILVSFFYTVGNRYAT